MNLTLAIDEQVAERARAAANKLGKSLNQVVRDYLEQLGGGRRANDWQDFEQRCLTTKARFRSWRFDRDTANER
jgi:hypothetical protein